MRWRRALFAAVHHHAGAGLSRGRGEAALDGKISRPGQGAEMPGPGAQAAVGLFRFLTL